MLCYRCRTEKNHEPGFCVCFGYPGRPLPNLLIVADGMGGHQAGDTASRYTVEVIVSHIKRSRERNPIRVLRSAIETANEK